MIVVVAPGQGSQTPGFLEPWIADPAHRARLEQYGEPSIPLHTNRDGSRVASGTDFVELLVGQVSSPVRWDLCMESFAAHGVTGIIELLPAGALVGLAKRALKGVPTVAVKTPDDLPAAIELLEAAA